MRRSRQPHLNPVNAEPDITFSPDDVSGFATWSADRNPLHVDPLFARQTHFGQQVVHGVLTVLRSLGAAGRPRRVRAYARHRVQERRTHRAAVSDPRHVRSGRVRRLVEAGRPAGARPARRPRAGARTSGTRPLLGVHGHGRRPRGSGCARARHASGRRRDRASTPPAPATCPSMAPPSPPPVPGYSRCAAMSRAWNCPG